MILLRCNRRYVHRGGVNMNLHRDECGLASVLLLIIVLVPLIALVFTASCKSPALEIAREETKAAEAYTRVQESKTEQARYDFKTAQERRLESEQVVELEQVKGDNTIKQAEADSMRWNAFAHVWLQVVWAILAAFVLFGFGLLIAWVLVHYEEVM